MSTELVLTYGRPRSGTKIPITAAVEGGALYTGKIDIAEPDARREFAEHLLEKWPGVELAEVISTNITDTIQMEYDQDFDGMPDFWELAFFGDVLSAVATDDFDMDGVSNLNEWISGTDPKDGASIFKGTMTTLSGGMGYTAIWAWDSIVGTTYKITRKTSPTDTMGTVIHQFVGDGSSTAFRVTGTVSANVFYCMTSEPTMMP